MRILRFETAWIAVASFAALAVPSSAQVIAGVVREDSTARPLAGVEVAVEGDKRSARTDSSGHFVLQASSGTKVVSYRLLGFQPLRMQVKIGKDTAKADADLVRIMATQLGAVQVTAPEHVAGTGRDGFSDRRKMGFGKFADSSALRERENRRTSDVLHELLGLKTEDVRDPASMITEVRAVSPFKQSTPTQSVMTPRGSAIVPGTPPCYVSVFLDGIALYRSDLTGGQGRPPDLSRDISVASLDAAEYYRSAGEVPTQFGGSNANCGALVLWTRR